MTTSFRLTNILSDEKILAIDEKKKKENEIKRKIGKIYQLSEKLAFNITWKYSCLK